MRLLRQRRLCSGSHLNRQLGRNIRTCSASVRWVCLLSQVQSVPGSKLSQVQCVSGWSQVHCWTVVVYWTLCNRFSDVLAEVKVSSSQTSERWRHSLFSKIGFLVKPPSSFLFSVQADEKPLQTSYLTVPFVLSYRLITAGVWFPVRTVRRSNTPTTPR